MKRDRSVVSVLSILLAGLMLGVACAAPVATTVPTSAPTSAPTATSAPPTATTVTATESATPEATQEPAGTDVATVSVATSSLGEILIGADGLSLYMFTKDVNGESACYDSCATNWPPLLTTDEPQAGDGVTDTLLGTVARTDGSMQVTYNKMPLYYYAKDKAAGDVVGQGVGDAWYVIAPSGDPIVMKMDEAPAGVGMLVNAADSKLGKILVDVNGMTLYLFTKDTDGESTCYDACATNWPPLLSKEKPRAGEGVDEALLGTVARTDGSLQVTYNKIPLYYFAKDKAAGDVTGQGVGDVWFVVTPSGEMVMATQAAAATSVPTADVTSAPAAPGALGGPGQTVEVAVLADFSPKSLTVRKGTTVLWTNRDSDEHTVTSDDGTSFKSASLTQGASFSFTFEQTGTYPYFCEYHGDRGGQGMSGTVTVVE